MGVLKPGNRGGGLLTGEALMIRARIAAFVAALLVMPATALAAPANAAASVAPQSSPAVSQSPPAVAQSSPAVVQSLPACAANGVALADGSFETPAESGSAVTFLPSPGGLGPWQTTDSQFELWSNAALGVASADGAQHVELNAFIAGTLYQAIATTPGSQIEWSFAHRARLVTGATGSAVDTMRLLIGSSLAAGISQGDFADNDSAWVTHAGLYTVPAGQTTTVFAFQAVSSSTADASRGNFLDSVSFATTPCLDVAASIADDNGGSVHPGDVLTIAISATNVGNSSAGDVRLASTVPAQTTYRPGSLRIGGVPVSDGAGDDAGELSGGVPTWRVGAGASAAAGGSLAPSAAATATYQVIVGLGASGTIAVGGAADAQWPGVGPLPQETSDPAIVPIVDNVADVSTSIAPVAESAAVGFVVAGGPIAFAVTTLNNGPDVGSALLVSSTLPAQFLNPVGVPDPAIPGGSCATIGSTVTCVYPSLAPGAAALTRLQGTLDPALPAGSGIGAAATSTSSSADPLPANNTSGTVVAAASAVSADLSISIAPGKLDAHTVLGAGSAVQYVARLTDLGPSDARSITVLLTLDRALREWTVTSSSPASCLAFGSTVICLFAALTVGTSVQLLINGTVSPAASSGSYVVTSTASALSSASPDPQLANNSTVSAVPLSIAASADLSTTAAITSPTVVSGAAISYLVGTVNAGPADAVGVTVTITVPIGVLALVGVPDPGLPGGVCITAGQVITCAYPVVRSGVTARTTVSGIVDPQLPVASTFALSAQSRSSTPDSSVANDGPARALTPPGGIRPASRPVSLAITGASPRADLVVALLLLLIGLTLVRSARMSRNH
jgi:uncharacterized repeat protein (TIGR01451 family)